MCYLPRSMNDRDAYIALNMMQGVGPVTVRALAAGLGAPARILTADAKELQRVPGRDCTTIPGSETRSGYFFFSSVFFLAFFSFDVSLGLFDLPRPS